MAQTPVIHTDISPADMSTSDQANILRAVAASAGEVNFNPYTIQIGERTVTISPPDVYVPQTYTAEEVEGAFEIEISFRMKIAKLDGYGPKRLGEAALLAAMQGMEEYTGNMSTPAEIESSGCVNHGPFCSLYGDD